MRTPDEKGNFSTEIDKDVIDKALSAVEKRAQSDACDDDAAASEGAVDVALADIPEDEAERRMQALVAARCEQKLQAEHEKLLRVAADFENYKKRAQRDRDDVQKYGSEKILKDLLPVFDNFDRALESANSSANFESFKTGMQMVQRLFADAIGRHGVKAFSAKGEPFDPTRHEAMSTVATDAMPPHHVFADVLKGFTLNDRLVRPALVVVSQAGGEASAAPDTSAAGPSVARENAEENESESPGVSVEAQDSNGDE